MPNTETLRTKKKYDRIARFYDMLEFFTEKKLFRRLREDMLKGLKGEILEIGVGTGKNIQYYGQDAKVTGIDISPKMLRKAIQKAEVAKAKVTLKLMDAQKLGFKDNSFDNVIGSFVLCSIPDPIRALKEMKRVVKKDGKIILTEHVLSKKRLIAFLENLHNPITKALTGVNVNRDTRQNIINAGLELQSDEELAFYDVIRRFTCTKAKV